MFIKFLQKYHRLFQPMCPTYAFIDRATGLFNRNMSFSKDYSALISAGWEIDTAYDEAEKDPVRKREKLDRLIGRDTFLSDTAMEKRRELFEKLYRNDGYPPDDFFDPLSRYTPDRSQFLYSDRM